MNVVAVTIKGRLRRGLSGRTRLVGHGTAPCVAQTLSNCRKGPSPVRRGGKMLDETPLEYSVRDLILSYNAHSWLRREHPLATPPTSGDLQLRTRRFRRRRPLFHGSSQKVR